jgi:hypothetical protein
MGAQPAPFHCGEAHGIVVTRLDALSENRANDGHANAEAHRILFERLSHHVEADGHVVSMIRIKNLEDNQAQFLVDMKENFCNAASATEKAAITADTAAKMAKKAAEEVAAIHKGEREEDQAIAVARKVSERKQAREDRWYLGLIAAVAIILASLLNHGAGIPSIIHTAVGK